MNNFEKDFNKCVNNKYEILMNTKVTGVYLVKGVCFTLFVICAILSFASGCKFRDTDPDPLATGSWKGVFYSENKGKKINPEIDSDYHDYINKELLPKRYYIDKNNT